MKKLNVIQIGIGHDHASVTLDSLLAQKELFNVLALAVPNREVTLYSDIIDRFTKQRGVPFMSIDEALALPGLDAVVVETEDIDLTDHALLALKKGFNVHMDKPGGISYDTFKACVDTAKEKNLLFHLGYMYRYNPIILDAMEKVKSGALGDIYAVEAHMDCDHNKEKREWLGTYPGGMLFFLGCHLIDLIYRIQGEPDEVIPLSCSTGYRGITADDYGMVVFKYPNGVSFAKTCAAEHGGFLRRQLVICGTNGTIEIRPLEAYHTHDNRLDLHTDVREVIKAPGAPSDWAADGERRHSEPYNRYDAMMADFNAMVCGDKENPYTLDYELKLFNLILRSCGAIK